MAKLAALRQLPLLIVVNPSASGGGSREGRAEKRQAKPPFVAPERSGGFAKQTEHLFERSEFCSGRKTSAERRGPAASGCGWRGALGPGDWAGNPLVAVRGRDPGFTVDRSSQTAGRLLPGIPG